MPYVDRPDGARIHYEVNGSGFPLLLIAPGGISSTIDFWSVAPVDPRTFADEFMVIGMDQRNAGESFGPAKAPTWAEMAADQVAVLDAVGAERTLLMGMCIGGPFILRFLQDAPGRAVAAVPMNSVGFAEGVNDRSTFFAMWEPTLKLVREQGMAAVVASAQENPVFARNNGGGPFAPRIAADAAFREQMLAMDPAEYERMILEYGELWQEHRPYVSVETEFVRGCQTPMLVLPGNDAFHPREFGHLLCREAPNARCTDDDWRAPEKKAETEATIRAFLREHAR